MIVDFHTHTFPDRIAAGALQKMQADTHARAFSDGTQSGLLSSMAASGINCSVVLPVATNPLKVSSINDISIAAIGASSLIYFGCIHPENDDYAQELSRIAAAGIKGIKIHPVYQGVDINDLRFLRILDKAAELGLMIVTHAGDEIAYPGIVRCSPEMIRSAVNQIGSMQLVLAHMGGWKNWSRIADCLADTAVYLDTSFSLGHIIPLEAGHYTPAQQQLLTAAEFCEIVRSFGADRILFGTDSPWACQKRALEDIRQLPLSDAEKTAILGGNACRLLQLT